MVVACQRRPAPASAPPASDARVQQIADAYLTAYFDRYPEEGTSYGVTGRRHDGLFENSLGALADWQKREDAWLADVKRVDPATLTKAPLKATYAILREALEASIDARVCRTELWNVSQMTGWQVEYGYLVTIQPVGTDQARGEALGRFAALPRFIDSEIGNLREGLRLGYSAPKPIVRIVIDQMDTLIASADDDSPFLSPAKRDTDPGFKQAFSIILKGQLVPAFVRYREFLEREYLPAARETIAVSAHPGGAACYQASIRAHSSERLSPEEVHALGVRQMEVITASMLGIAERSYHTDNVPALLQRLRTDPAFRFKNRDELIGRSTAALARAKGAMSEWFSLVPRADVRIEPYPRFREKNAPNEYNPPAEDGSRPALFYISAYQAEMKSRAPAESTAFHETIPGHHLQIALALERKGIHPIGRYIRNGGFTEGWARYAGRLADEMHLYSSDEDRLGMLSSQAYRAARLVVDTGVHAKGWTRQQAIDYMLTHTAESPGSIASEVDRYIIWPGQATGYMLGMLRIYNVREEARLAMRDGWDIKAFHDRVLEDGAVPLPFLTEKIREWAAP